MNYRSFMKLFMITNDVQKQIRSNNLLPRAKIWAVISDFILWFLNVTLFFTWHFESTSFLKLNAKVLLIEIVFQREDCVLGCWRNSVWHSSKWSMVHIDIEEAVGRLNRCRLTIVKAFRLTTLNCTDFILVMMKWSSVKTWRTLREQLFHQNYLLIIKITSSN